MKILAVIEESIPKVLRRRKQWVAWRPEVKEDGKISKIPVNPKTGHNASISDPTTWRSFKKAFRYYRNHRERGIKGVGFVLTKDDPFVGIDLDKCRDPETGKILSWAAEIIGRVNSYSEVSPSGRGIRIFATGELPTGGNKKGDIEMYDNGRYFTVTGQHLEGTPEKIRKKPNTIKKLHSEIFKKEEMVNSPRETPVSTLLTDEGIIERAMAAKNGDKFAKLWKGDCTDYKSQSEADLGLCSMLAFWTGRDPSRMDQLFRQSGLMRDKWNEPHNSNKETYGQMTIDKAIASSQEVYAPDPIQAVIEKLPGILESCKADPKNAVGGILNDQPQLKDLALLAKENRPKFEAFLLDLKKMGVVVRDIEGLKKAINEEKKTQRTANIEQQPTQPMSIKSCVPDAPLSGEFVVPNGWIISPQEVAKVRFDKKSKTKWKEAAAPNAVLIQGRLKNMVDYSEDLRLAWLRDNKWEFRIADRGEIADAKLIVKLAEFGFPVTSVSAPRMVEFLAALETVNSGFLPQAIVTHKMGWQGEKGEFGFLWGHNLITAAGKLLANLTVEQMPPEEWPKDLVFFRGHDSGEEQIAKGFRKRGKFKKWKKAISLARKYPLLTCGIYASLSAPLLHILEADNFIVDWAFPTSTGKTSTLKIAASCWGNPNEKASSTVMKGWDATGVWVERSSNVLHSLPLVIDDTKRAKNPDVLVKFIYNFTYGQGRGRGSPQGMRETDSWLTVALTCGESKITNFSTGDGGSHARVLSIWGSAFGKKSKKKAKRIRKIIRITRKNYGHAGYRFVTFLLKNKDRWNEWRQGYSELIRKYEDQAGSNVVALRQAPYLAVIHMTANLAKKALGLKINYEKHLAKVSRRIMGEVSEADRAREARESVFSWLASNQAFFWSGESDSKQPNQGWLGVWDPDGSGKLVAIFPHQLAKFLKDSGYEAKATIRTWKDKGWLDTSGERKGLTKKVKMGEERPRCYVLHRKSKLRSAVGQGQEPEM